MTVELHSAADASEHSGQPAAARRVLAIDDSPTILKFIEMVLGSAGYEVRTTVEPALACQQVDGFKPDIALLDYLMRDGDGVAAARQLRARPGLGELPVILMSAKGESVKARLYEIGGVFDLLSKPFTPEVLLTVVSHTLSRSQRQARESGSSEIAGLIRRLGQTDPHLPAPLPSDRGRYWREVLSGFLCEHARRIGGLSHTTELVTWNHFLEGALSGPTFERLRAALEAADAGAQFGCTVCFQGQLENFPLTEILQLAKFHHQRLVVRLQRDHSEIYLFLSGGCFDFALASQLGHQFHLGTLLLRNRRVTHEQLEAAVRYQRAKGVMLGQALLELGAVDQATLAGSLKRQTMIIIYEALRWGEGRFRVERWERVPPPYDQFRFELPVDMLTIEGLRRIDEWHLIEQKIPNFDQVFRRADSGVSAARLERLVPSERAILQLVDGRRSVAAIIAASYMEAFKVCKSLYSLLLTNLIAPSSSPPPPGS
jgi:CheY-like chemotaxis protein